jgi:hypothetical protein
VSASPLIARVAAVLDQSGVRYALIGAGALAASDRPSLIQEVESRLEALPGQARQLWHRLLHGA